MRIAGLEYNATMPATTMAYVVTRTLVRLFAWVVALELISVPWPVHAVMPPWVYEKARNEAMYHVQVRILTVNGPAKTPGECAITGELVRIFRDKSGKLKQGTRVAFTVSCRKSADPAIASGTLWQDYDAMLDAQYIEVFLNSNGRGYEVALWQSSIIEKPSDQPTMK
jgi:hypothetical protein